MTDVGDAPSASPCRAPYSEGTEVDAASVVLSGAKTVCWRVAP